MKRIILTISLLLPIFVGYTQEVATWFEKRIAINVGFERQFALNEDAGTINIPAAFGYKITPRWNIMYCASNTFLLNQEKNSYNELVGYGLGTSYQILSHKEPKINQFNIELEGRFLYGQKFGTTDFDNLNYNINIKFVPAYHPYLYAGIGFHHYLFQNKEPDLYCGFFSFGIRY